LSSTRSARVAKDEATVGLVARVAGQALADQHAQQALDVVTAKRGRLAQKMRGPGSAQASRLREISLSSSLRPWNRLLSESPSAGHARHALSTIGCSPTFYNFQTTGRSLR